MNGLAPGTKLRKTSGKHRGAQVVVVRLTPAGRVIVRTERQRQLRGQNVGHRFDGRPWTLDPIKLSRYEVVQ